MQGDGLASVGLSSSRQQCDCTLQQHAWLLLVAHLRTPPSCPADHRIPECPGVSQECQGEFLPGLLEVLRCGSLGPQTLKNHVVLSSSLSQLNLWRYGDFRADDADEFGYSR